VSDEVVIDQLITSRRSLLAHKLQAGVPKEEDEEEKMRSHI
jgi:hypothetical protein